MSVTVSVAVSKMGDVLHQTWSENQLTVLLGYLLSQQILDAMRCVIDGNVIFQQDGAFNTVQLLQWKNANLPFFLGYGSKTVQNLTGDDEI